MTEKTDYLRSVSNAMTGFKKETGNWPEPNQTFLNVLEGQDKPIYNEWNVRVYMCISPHC